MGKICVDTKKLEDFLYNLGRKVESISNDEVQKEIERFLYEIELENRWNIDHDSLIALVKDFENIQSCKGTLKTRANESCAELFVLDTESDTHKVIHEVQNPTPEDIEWLEEVKNNLSIMI